MMTDGKTLLIRILPSPENDIASETEYHYRVNTRRLRRLLRERIPHFFPSRLLHPIVDWSEELGNSITPLGQTLWSE